MKIQQFKKESKSYEKETGITGHSSTALIHRTAYDLVSTKIQPVTTNNAPSRCLLYQTI